MKTRGSSSEILGEGEQLLYCLEPSIYTCALWVSKGVYLRCRPPSHWKANLCNTNILMSLVICVHMCACVCVHAPVCGVAHGFQKNASDSLELHTI